jgi:hypothetical protein
METRNFVVRYYIGARMQFRYLGRAFPPAVSSVLGWLAHKRYSCAFAVSRESFLSSCDYSMLRVLCGIVSILLFRFRKLKKRANSVAEYPKKVYIYYYEKINIKIFA